VTRKKDMEKMIQLVKDFYPKTSTAHIKRSLLTTQSVDETINAIYEENVCSILVALIAVAVDDELRVQCA